LPGDGDDELEILSRSSSAYGQTEGQEKTLQAILGVVEAIRQEALASSTETNLLLRELIGAVGGGRSDDHPAGDLPKREAAAVFVGTGQTQEAAPRRVKEEDSEAAEERALERLRQLAQEAGLDTENDAFHRKSCGQMVWPWKGGVDGGPALCPACHLPNGGFLETDGARRKALELMAEEDRREGTPQVPMGSIGRWVEQRRKESGAGLG